MGTLRLFGICVIYYMFNRLQQTLGAPDPLMGGSLSVGLCDLTKVLEQENIPSQEWPLWHCLAWMASRFNASSIDLGDTPSYPSVCSSTRYGIFGITSPLCSANSVLVGCSSYCRTLCEDLPNNILESVRCLRGGTLRLHRHYIDCQTFPPIQYNPDTCSKFKEKESSDAWFVVFLVFSIVGLLFWVIAGVVLCICCCGWTQRKCRIIRDWWTRRKRRTSAEEAAVLGDLVVPNTNQITAVDKLRNELLEGGGLLDSNMFSINYQLRLGSGCFGVVYEASVMGKPAAVKVLNECPKDHDVLSLLSEIRVLAKLDNQRNIVSLLGYSIEGDSAGEIKLFLELCSGGSLENYLRKHRNEFANQLKKAHLIRWSYQIAGGMAYLSSKNILHGDLATRNVLLDEAQVAKISDFGFSRCLYSDTHYMKKGVTTLPWRWMSPEALRHMKFSSASDVWSFGVTLFEIFSLGSIPYPGLTYTPGFMDMLSIFNLRPGKPLHADDGIYNSVIEPCWTELEMDRPTFPQIRDILRPLLIASSAELGYCGLDDQE